MAHTVVKFTKGGKFEAEGVADKTLKGWHLYSDVADGEFTACGYAVVDYDHTTKVKERGGVTCESCLEVIKYYKKIRL